MSNKTREMGVKYLKSWLTHYDGIHFAFNLECGVVAAKNINHLFKLSLLYYQIMNLFLIFLNKRHRYNNMDIHLSCIMLNVILCAFP